MAVSADTAVKKDAAAETQSPRKDGQVIGLIGAGHFISHFLIFTLPPLLPLLKQELNVSYAALGLVATVFNLVSAATQLPVGMLVDRVRPTLVLILGIIVGGLAFIAMGVIGTYLGLLIMAAVAGLANSVYHPADYRILSQIITERRMGRAFSLHTFTGYAGGAVAPLLVIAVALQFGWQGALIGAGILALAVALLLIVFRGILDRAQQGETADTSREQRHKMSGERSDATASTGTFVSRHAFLFSPAALLCFAFFTLLSLSSGGINNFSVAALVERGAAALPTATTALTGFLVAGAVGILAGGIIADKTRHHDRVAICGFGLTAMAVCLVGAVDLPAPLLIAVMICGGFTFGMIMPSRDMLVRKVAPAHAVATMFAFVSVGLNVGGALSPALFGWVMDNSNPSFVFFGAAAFMIVTMMSAFATRWTRV